VKKAMKPRRAGDSMAGGEAEEAANERKAAPVSADDDVSANGVGEVDCYAVDSR
jgi:hypothetical protein